MNKTTINIKTIITTIVILLLFIFISSSLGEKSLTLTQYVLFFVIGTICIFGIIKEINENGYSLSLMHWLFVLFFFFISPIIQITNDINMWGIHQDSKTIKTTCLLIIIWCVAYNIGQFIQNKQYNKNTTEDNNTITTIYKKTSPPFLTILSIISVSIIVNYVGIGNMFSRGTASLFDVDSLTQTEALLINGVARTTIIFSAAYSTIYLIKNKRNNRTIYSISCLINILLLLLACFPTGISRNTAGTVYLGLFVLLYYSDINKIHKRMKYALLFILSFMLIFPAMNAYRNASFEDTNLFNSLSTIVKETGETFITGNYDAFSMVGNTINYANDNGIVYGRQILGSVLFFIPRSVWPNKPIGTGSMIFSSLGKQFTNVSCPLPSEFYINFGYFGVIIFAIIIGYSTKAIDKKYWKSILNKDRQNDFLIIFYPFLLPIFFFMMRGDMMSTFTNLTTYLLIFFILYRLVTKKYHIRNNAHEKIR